MERIRTWWSGEFGGLAVAARRPAKSVAVALLFFVLPSISNGQVDRRALQPVEQGVADTGPLSANRRVVPLDLRVPSGFDRVYKFGQGSSSKFARRSGGITAVFPRSTYIGSTSGLVALIPPGTVFYVGKLPDSLFGGGVAGLGSRPILKPLMLVDTSAIDSARAPANRPADSRQGNRAVVPPGQVRESTTAFSVFDDERFRTRRIEELLDRALRAGEKAARGHGPKRSEPLVVARTLTAESKPVEEVSEHEGS